MDMSDLKGIASLILFVLTFFSLVSSSYAIETQVKGDMATRYIKLSNNLNDFAQANANLNFLLKPSEQSKFVTTLRTGNHFSHPWDNYVDFRHDNPDYSPVLRPRNMYWQADTDKFGEWQVGFLPVYNNGINLTSKLSDFGWADGLRWNYSLQNFGLSFFSGSIDDPSKVNVFDRKMKWDHFELNSYYDFSNGTRLAFNILRDDLIYFIQIGGAFHLSSCGQMFLDSLVDDQGESKSSITLDYKVERVLPGFRTSLSYQYMSEDFSRMGTKLSHPLFKSTKNSVVAKASIPLLEKEKLTWFVATKQNTDHLLSLYYTGISLGFN